MVSKATTISRSSAKVEYRALASVVSEISWLQALPHNFEAEINSALLFCDSQSIVYLSTNSTFHERSKHVEIDCCSIPECVAKGPIKLVHVKSQHQLVDLLTKSVYSSRFKGLISKLGILNIYMPT